MITYKNFPVFPYEIKPLNTITKTISHKRQFIGKQWQKEIYFYIQQERYTVDLTFGFDNYNEMRKIRDFYFDRKGRAYLFWLPTWNNDLLPIRDINQGSNELIVERAFLDVYKTIKRPLVLYFPKYNFITYATDVREVFDETLAKIGNKITLADSFPFAMSKNTCDPVQFLFLGRWQTDTINFKFIDLVRGECNLSFSELSRIDYKRYIPEVIMNN